MKLVWVVSVKMSRSWIMSRCIFEHFEPALDDFRSHDGIRFIYPKIMSNAEFKNLPERNGW